MDNIKHIVCNIDDNYVMPYVTMVHSLRHNNPHSNFHVHIISSGLKSQTEADIRSYSETQEIKVSFYSLDKTWVEEHLPQLKGHISTATFYRCFMSDVLPKEIQKALYLDCDLIITDSLEELWTIDLGDSVVGAVEDMWALNGAKDKRLGYPDSYSYFNAGVLLINMEEWRKMDITHLSLDYLARFKEVLKYNDQDILNGLLYNRKKWLPVRYNMQDGFYRLKRRYLPEHMKEEVDANLIRPAILHYTGAHKPWEFKCYHPLRQLYFPYLDNTPYAHKFPKFKFVDWAEKVSNQFIWALHLKKPKYRKLK